jgi:hypothetical protein
MAGLDDPKSRSRISMLLQVFFDALCLAMKERNVLIGDFEEVFDHVQGLLELRRELDMLLIAPGVAQPNQLGVQSRQAFAHIAVELLEVVSEAPQFERINDGLRHRDSQGGRDLFIFPHPAAFRKGQNALR